jgi:hypothetical protein
MVGDLHAAITQQLTKQIVQITILKLQGPRKQWVFKKETVCCYTNSWMSTIRVSPVHLLQLLLGAFAKDQKRLFLHPSVRLSLHIELGSHSTEFHDIWYLRIFRRSVREVQVSLRSDKNNGYFTWTPMYVYDNITLNSS